MKVEQDTSNPDGKQNPSPLSKAVRNFNRTLLVLPYDRAAVDDAIQMYSSAMFGDPTLKEDSGARAEASREGARLTGYAAMLAKERGDSKGQKRYSGIQQEFLHVAELTHSES